MSAHTPGPWKIDRHQCQLYIVDPDGNRAITRIMHGRPEGEANANLIAAAPELLDALVAIVNAWEHGAEFGSNEIGDARKAITKAGGKQ